MMRVIKWLGGRKFVAVLLATGLLVAHCITQWVWLAVVLVWLGVEGWADIITRGQVK